MKVRKSLMVAGALVAVGLTGAANLGAVSASDSTTNGVSSLVEKIATKFNLNKGDLQKVFDEEKAAHEAERQQEASDRLEKAVDDGKITAEQKTLIENKQKELKTQRETRRTELEDWASQNSIDAKLFMMRGPHGGDSDRLQTAVDSGKITAEQKTLIENKQKELKTQRDAEHTALKKWADDNKIDMKYLMGGGQHGPKGGERPFRNN